MWKRGLAYFGEQGGENLYKQLHRIEENARVRGEELLVRTILKAHLAKVAPEYFVDK